jgi:hypothetical protein
VTKRTAVKVLIPCGVVLLAAAAALSAATRKLGYSEIPDGRGGTNVEAAVYAPEMGFDKARSLTAFKETLYPLLRQNCRGCHSTENKLASGAQAPVHSDVDVNLAHEYALTRVNFREPRESKFVVRMEIDRHNCFAENCGVAANQMLAAVTAWRNRIADMIPEVPRSIPANTKVTDDQILAWIESDKAKTPAAEREFIKYTSFHVLHNAGVSAQNLNHARAGLSKALNGAARWAPKIVNPVDVNGKGILYRFDIRDYWGYTLIDTSAPDFELFNTLSDDDIGFAAAKVDRNGKKPPWLDEGGAQIPTGDNGAGAWIDDPATVKRVRELFRPSAEALSGAPFFYVLLGNWPGELRLGRAAIALACRDCLDLRVHVSLPGRRPTPLHEVAVPSSHAADVGINSMDAVRTGLCAGARTGRYGRRGSAAHHPDKRTEPPDTDQPWTPRQAARLHVLPPAVPEHPQGEKVRLGRRLSASGLQLHGASRRADQNDDQPLEQWRPRLCERHRHGSQSLPVSVPPHAECGQLRFHT